MAVLSRMTMFPQVFLRQSPRFSKLSLQRQPVRNFRTKKSTEPKSDSPSFKKDIYGEFASKNQEEGQKVLGKYIAYAVVAVPAFFTGCAIWQYENVRQLLQRKPPSHIHSMQINNEKEFQFRTHLNALWNSFSPARRLVLEIIAANIAVYLLFKVRPLYPIMSRYFISLPTRAHSVLGSTLSAFSHISGVHLFMNMYVLWSFSRPMSNLLGKEQFLAVYLAGGTISGLTSSMYRVMSGRMIPSVGASGAILSLIAIVCMEFPNSRLSIAFVNQIIPHSFSGKTALMGVILLDVVGLARGWGFLDHAGHLGGTLFGLFYVKYGRHYFEVYKRAVLKRYHAFRSKQK